MLDSAAIDFDALESVLDRFAEQHPEPVEKEDPADPEWKRLHRLMDKAEPKLRAGFLDAIARLQTADVRRAVEERIDAGDIEGAVSAIPWEDAGAEILEGGFMSTYRDLFEQAGTVSAKLIPEVEPFDFAVNDRRALDFLEQHGAKFVTEMNGAGRAAVRAALVRSEREGLSVVNTGKLLMQHVGLTERLSNAVSSRLMAQIAAGKSESKAAADAQLYAKRLLTYRVHNIARTESQMATSSGQTAAWEEAADSGLIDRGTALQFWITARDEVVAKCPICGPMDGQECALGEMFTTGEGEQIDGPPAHPSCRCSRGLSPGGSRLLKHLGRVLVFKRARHLYELPHEWWKIAA